MPLISSLIHLRTKKPLEVKGSVALVGSSDLLSGASFGSEIDSFDHVFRFNLASLDEHYKDAVGSKADFYFFSQMITTYRYPHPEPLQTHFKTICRKSQVICYPGHTENVVKFNKRPFLMTLDVPMINSIFTSLLGHSKWEFPVNNHPRNGIKLLASLLANGTRPTLFGFDISDRGDNCHYFDREYQLETPERGHKPSIEFVLLSELHEKGLIDIRT
jgi:glycosyl transferase family 29 (putative sialyltransferase)